MDRVRPRPNMRMQERETLTTPLLSHFTSSPSRRPVAMQLGRDCLQHHLSRLPAFLLTAASCGHPCSWFAFPPSTPAARPLLVAAPLLTVATRSHCRLQFDHRRLQHRVDAFIVVDHACSSIAALSLALVMSTPQRLRGNRLLLSFEKNKDPTPERHIGPSPIQVRALLSRYLPVSWCLLAFILTPRSSLTIIDASRNSP